GVRRRHRCRGRHAEGPPFPRFWRWRLLARDGSADPLLPEMAGHPDQGRVGGLNMQHYLNYIDGQWRDASRQLTVMNPGTGEPYATIAQAGIEDADLAMAAARRCVDCGALTEVRPAIRTGWLLKAAEAIRAIADDGAL